MGNLEATMDQSAEFLASYVSRQLENLFPSFGADRQIIPQEVQAAVDSTSRCVSRARDAKFSEFNYLISGHNAQFLYHLSREVAKDPEAKVIASKLFLLNKAVNGIDLYYEVEMPDYFLIGHTVGMVFAKACYGNYCVFHQGCTVGRNGDERPILEDGVSMYPNSSIIGRCHVRSNTVLTPGVQLINQDSPGNCYVFMGERGRPIFKELNEYYPNRFYSQIS